MPRPCLPGFEDRAVPRSRAAEPAVWAVFVSLLILNYLPTFRWMIERWNEPGSFMSHGWLVPAISAWLLWREREGVRLSAGPGAASGWLLIFPALALHLVSGLADVASLSGLTLIPLLAGFTALRFGWKTLRAAWFPILFLAAMVPPPEFIISGINFNLKLLAADIAAWLLNVTGLPAVRTGSFMLFGEERLAVGDACSGLRSLLSLLSFGVLFAWLVRSKGKAQVLAVLAATVPAAVLGNGLRICLVSYLVYWLGAEKVFRPRIGSWDLHLLTGGVIFAAALGVLVGISVLLEGLAGMGKKAAGKKGT
jgi:exosortase